VAFMSGVQTQAGVMPAQARIQRVIGDVFSTKSGLLYCDTCHLGWCNHVGMTRLVYWCRFCLTTGSCSPMH
jgi:hypothetical protein